ncbi:MAG: Gfo/Idh/MocA family oxidoreductase [Phycisphaerales bacterium]|nr:Gfo/Idh/MocA family oxidoreductase [Phycisphaerales bacterium]
MNRNVTRRELLSTGGTVAAGLTMNTLLREARAAEANERLTIGVIGCGGMGRYNMDCMQRTGQCDVAAVCDIDRQQAERTAARSAELAGGHTPEIVPHYQRILDRKDIDIVIIATPDHWHAIQFLNACAAGKDIYCEKPCCHNIREGRRMVDATKKYGRVVQIGTLQRSQQHFQEARDFIQQGKLGKITMTHTYTYENESPQGMGNAPDSEPPSGVDYNEWLGPAPLRPFNSRRFHGSWRWYFDYAAGMVGDWNVHLQDIIQWVMRTPYPVSVNTEGGHYVLEDDRDTSDTMQTVYDFGSYVQTFSMRKASGKPWYVPGGHGMDFYGTNGMLHLSRSGWRIEGDEVNWSDRDNHELRTPNFEAKGRTVYEPHVQDFIDCVRTRKTTIAPIEEHYPIVVACHLANVSYLAKHKIFWDREKELCFKDRKLTVLDQEANEYLGREYRKGYELPEV